MQFTLNDSDLKIEWYSGTGCGGQNRNKVQSSCRLTHIPTGITQTAQTRSRNSSYTLAYSKLSEEVIKIAQAKHCGSIAALRKDQVGTGMRGDKTRTYRFQDDIVTDHTSGKRSSVKKVLAGNFDLLW